MVENVDNRHGFVLIELIVVVGLIGLIVAVAFPALLPAIAFTHLEGTARHISGFGMGAMAHATLMGERVTVHIDLDTQEYWAMRWPKPEMDSVGEALEESGSMVGSLGEEDLLSLLKSPEDRDKLSEEDQEALAGRRDKMSAGFDQLVQLRLMDQAKNVKPPESMMDEIGPLFEKEFSLDEEDALKPEEITGSGLNRTKMPSDIRIESVSFGEIEKTKGLVEVEISPLGLSGYAVFVIRDNDEECFTIVWDPITGFAYVEEGDELGS